MSAIARSVDFTSFLDSRGLLVAAQTPDSLPFQPIRVFVVTGSPAGTERGGHAHRTCHQLIFSTTGGVLVEFDDDSGTHTVTLDGPESGLYLPPLVWAKQTYVTEGSSLTALASHVYDGLDYVDDREEAAALRQANAARTSARESVGT